ETIVKEGQTVQNEDYHKVYDALTSMKNVEKVTFSSKQEQYNKLTETMGSEWDVFDEENNPLYDAYIVETKAPKYVES
ncbi:permease-like cell division protein FtsX, partial [Streptococcus pneumoniae]|nr:permease-like cell division protein FtsX [Streptococcus pneumoniae]